MTEPRDHVLREVARLPDPALPAPRAEQIQRLARARFVMGAVQTPARRSSFIRAAECVAAAVLCASVAGYLMWTAVTVASLHPRGEGVLRGHVISGAAR